MIKHRVLPGFQLESASMDCNRCTTKTSLILAITIPFVLFVLGLLFIISILTRRNARLITLAKKYELESEYLLDPGPQKFKHKDLTIATQGFSSDELLGVTGFGSIYRGRLWLNGTGKPIAIAVKRIPAVSHQGAREILTEVKIIAQVQHRNIVRLLGWCHENGELLLVYDYMPNGSVDEHLFTKADAAGEPVLTWARRLKIVGGVATALAYMHEEWGQRVLHRDVKSSNVMLDRDFNARLGDFGLGRTLSTKSKASPPSTVSLAGTYGYMAPEIAPTLKVTQKTDVYSFGAMVLEVATGKRPILSDEDKGKCDETLLVDWGWNLHRDDTLLDAADSRLKNAFDPGEMIMFLKIGLLCSHPDPDQRPTMREVLKIWKGSSQLPILPRSKPVPVFSFNFESFQTSVTIFPDHDHGSDESGEQTFASQSDGCFTLMAALKNDGHSIPPGIPPPQRSEPGQTGCSPMPTLRCRPCSTSLPL